LLLIRAWFADRFGGKERIKYFILHVFRAPIADIGSTPFLLSSFGDFAGPTPAQQAKKNTVRNKIY
jgi:hypothetical protein